MGVLYLFPRVIFGYLRVFYAKCSVSSYAFAPMFMRVCAFFKATSRGVFQVGL
jgi:hypothetical protein